MDSSSSKSTEMALVKLNGYTTNPHVMNLGKGPVGMGVVDRVGREG